MNEKETRLKIVHLITDSGTGGAEKMMFELVSRLDPRRFSCKVIVMKRPGRTAQMMLGAGVEVASLELPPEFDAAYAASLPAAAARLIKLLRRQKPDILHCWLFQANMLGRMAASLLGTPNISSLRVVESERMVHYPLDRMTRGLVTRYVAVCEAVAAHYTKVLRLRRGEVAVIPNGIETGPYESARGEAFRRRLGVPRGVPVAGSLGRLHRQKGMDLLIRAMCAVASAHPRAVLVVGGDGPESGALKKLAASSPIKDRIIFAGQVEDAVSFMAAMDVFLLASRWEGMPNVLLEAMAAGKPVVAARVGGTPEVVADGETGILVPPDDERALARAITGLLGDPEKMKSMGEAGRGLVRAGFSVERMVRRYAELYQAMVAGK